MWSFTTRQDFVHGTVHYLILSKVRLENNIWSQKQRHEGGKTTIGIKPYTRLVLRNSDCLTLLMDSVYERDAVVVA